MTTSADTGGAIVDGCFQEIHDRAQAWLLNPKSPLQEPYQLALDCLYLLTELERALTPVQDFTVDDGFDIAPGEEPLSPASEEAQDA